MKTQTSFLARTLNRLFMTSTPAAQRQAVMIRPGQHPAAVPNQDIQDYGQQPYMLPAQKVVKLSDLVWRGAQVHKQCRHGFVEQVICGHYAYSRRVSYRTNVVAAAWVGLLGPDVIEVDVFPYKMVIWQLNKALGYDIEKTIVDGPTGRRGSVVNEMIQLMDVDYWTREGVAIWLHDIGL